MNRPYTQEDFRNLIDRIHRFIPDAGIGVDTLVGFPGETETAFETTYNLIEALPVSYLHVFPYSARRQTPASRHSGRIPPEIVKDRCRKMRDLGELKKKAFYKGWLGKTVKILVESKRDPASGLLKGFSSNLIPVIISGGDELKNTIVSVEIIRLNGTKPLFGELVSYSQ
jgi:threonylcarbamoyladenosine tRNA methylthiotransferase MtaB